MHELEPDPESLTMNTREGIIAAKATGLPIVGLQQRRSGPGSGLGGALGGIPLGSDVLVSRSGDSLFGGSC